MTNNSNNKGNSQGGGVGKGSNQKSESSGGNSGASRGHYVNDKTPQSITQSCATPPRPPRDKK